eukprot:6141056-Prymnesium_polylepis.1
MATSLPQLSPRTGVNQQPTAKRQDAGYATMGYDATQESVSDWTPHDVAEWLYLQADATPNLPAACAARADPPLFPTPVCTTLRRLPTPRALASWAAGDQGRPHAHLPGAQHRRAGAARADAREAARVARQGRRLQHHPQGRAGTRRRRARPSQPTRAALRPCRLGGRACACVHGDSTRDQESPCAHSGLRLSSRGCLKPSCTCARAH